ncbi:EXS-domain-containing protein [Sesbania bispinosa]|nr:EXS-domain-containing protein [Sesbania bispinosa]
MSPCRCFGRLHVNPSTSAVSVPVRRSFSVRCEARCRSSKLFLSPCFLLLARLPPPVEAPVTTVSIVAPSVVRALPCAIRRRSHHCLYCFTLPHAWHPNCNSHHRQPISLFIGHVRSRQDCLSNIV